MHEDKPHVFKLKWMFDLWEELNWRWWEELKIVLRDLLREMQTDSPTRDDLKFYAMAPGPDGFARLRMPSTFQLGDPSAYYLTTVLPRAQRQDELKFYQIVRQQPQKPRKAGGTDNAPPEDPPPNHPAARRSPALGRPLSQHEAARATKKGPMSSDGSKKLCWDFSCHAGCQRLAGSCWFSHESITNSQTLDWTVVAEITRRGGLKASKKIPVVEIDTRVKHLREEAHKEDLSKRDATGKARGGGNRPKGG